MLFGFISLHPDEDLGAAPVTDGLATHSTHHPRRLCSRKHQAPDARVQIRCEGRQVAQSAPEVTALASILRTSDNLCSLLSSSVARASTQSWNPSSRSAVTGASLRPPPRCAAALISVGMLSTSTSSSVAFASLSPVSSNVISRGGAGDGASFDHLQPVAGSTPFEPEGLHYPERHVHSCTRANSALG
jgi:hypothetical protein